MGGLVRAHGRIAARIELSRGKGCKYIARNVGVVDLTADITTDWD